MGEVSCFSMDIYCDHPEHTRYGRQEWNFPTVYTGSNFADVIRQARRDGWYFSKKKEGDVGSGYALCPVHAKMRKKLESKR